MTLIICLLGSVQISRNDRPVPIRGAKPAALLAYLLVTGKAHTRQHLLDLLFEAPTDPRASLRWTLADLRQAIGPAYILADRQQVAFNFEGDYWLDVAAFEAGQLDLYRGDFLEGLQVRGAFGFEAWSLFERERLRGAYQAALIRQLKAAENRANDPVVVETAHKLLRLDNLGEAVYRALMRAYARQGQREAALAQFDLCRQVLQTELGVEPAAETAALAEAIRQGQIGTTADFSSTALLPGASPPHNLPPQPSLFVGREEELSELDKRLSNPACRLLTLVGPGGIGKTRLALAGAARLLLSDTFPDGIYFAPLASLSSADFLVAALAGSLNFSLQSGQAPKVQLLNFLRSFKSALLLVLDNFEHLLTPPQEPEKDGGVGLLIDILQAAPTVKLLVTSRERLNLRQEWLLGVSGLQFPHTSQPEERLEAYSAVQLFLQRAATLEPTFTLSATDKPWLVRICQLVAGMPLGLELAAAWVRVLSCQEIAREIETNLNFLTTAWPDMPARHRSLRAVFDHSWSLLTVEEQRVFEKLTVFRGGFERETAESVANASLAILSALVDKSILRRNPSGRYEMHELLRQYGQEKLRESGELEQAQGRHLAYYLALAEVAEPQLWGGEQVAWFNRLEAEQDNLRAALSWSLTGHPAAERYIEAGVRLAGALWMFWYIRGYLTEGRKWLDQAVSRALPGLALAKALCGAGTLAWQQGDYNVAQPYLEMSVALWRAGGPAGQAGLAEVLHMFGHLTFDQSEYIQAAALFAESLALYQELGDPVKGLPLIGDLGMVAYHQGDYATARARFEESLKCHREQGIKEGSAEQLNRLGELARLAGDYRQAAVLYEESLELCRELRDKGGVASALHKLGYVARFQGDLPRALRLFGESLVLQRELGNKQGIAECLAGLAGLAGPAEQAAQLFGAAEALLEAVGAPLAPADQVEWERDVATVRVQLDPTVFDAAWQAGRRLGPEQAMAAALAKAGGGETAAETAGIPAAVKNG